MGAFVGLISEILGASDIDVDARIELSTKITWKNVYDVIDEIYRLFEVIEKKRLEELENAQTSELLEILTRRPSLTMTFILCGEKPICRQISERSFVERFRGYIPAIEEYSEETESEVNEYFRRTL
jgi:hypothetical protein